MFKEACSLWKLITVINMLSSSWAPPSPEMWSHNSLHWDEFSWKSMCYYGSKDVYPKVSEPAKTFLHLFQEKEIILPIILSPNKFSNLNWAFSTSYFISCFTIFQCIFPSLPSTCSYQKRICNVVFSEIIKVISSYAYPSQK